MSYTRPKPRKYWSCPCGTRNPRLTQKCACGRKRPKPRVAVHARTLRDNSYEHFREINEVVHGPAMGPEWDSDCCGVCGKPPSQDRHNDRDHGHLRGSLTYGKARGLACGGNQGCNILMLPWVTATAARGIAEAKQRAGELDRERWALIAAYLKRIEDHYGEPL